MLSLKTPVVPGESPVMIWGSLGGLGDLGCGVGVALVTLGGICEWPWEFLEEV